MKQAKCLEPLAFHVKEGMEKVATVPAKVAQRKLTILEGKLCEQVRNKYGQNPEARICQQSML